MTKEIGTYEIKLYDLVRPTKEWIVDYINKPITVPDDWFCEKEIVLRKEAGIMFSTSVGYVKEISSWGQYAVKWLTKSQADCFFLHTAWWNKEELEVLGNALQICKDLI